MDRGDIYLIDLNPGQGKEQLGKRPVLIVSHRNFNHSGTSIVCPITSGGNYARFAGFAVPLSGAGTSTQGVVLCNQIRSLDIDARCGRFVEQAPDFIVEEVIAKLQALLE
jgi:mRNA interferase ChpB